MTSDSLSCRCPSCNRPLPDVSKPICPTCEADTGGWCALKWYQRFAIFPIGVWLVLLLMLVTANLFHLLLRGGWPPSDRWLPAEAEALLIGTAALGISLLLYVNREHVRMYEQRRQCSEHGYRPSLALLTAVILVGGTSAALLTAVGTLLVIDTGKIHMETGGDTLPLVVAGAVMLMALAPTLMLLGIAAYVKRFHERYPHPIFHDIERLSKVAMNVLRTVYLPRQAISDATKRPTDPEPPILRSLDAVEIESVHRNSRLGLDLVVCEHVTIWTRDERREEYIGKHEANHYDVSTDEWGSIFSLDPRKRDIKLPVFEANGRKDR